jgi:uncharacterized membrane protein (UPF0127 family)
MLFPFSPARRVSLWMRNVSIPLDMIFIRDGRVTQIERATPCVTTRCPRYGSLAPVDSVMEIGGGRAAELGLRPGDRIRITPAVG